MIAVNLGDLAVWASLVAGAIATLMAGWTFFNARRVRAEVLKTLELSKFEEIMRSDDLDLIGAYVVSDLGSLPITELARDEAVRKRATDVFDRVRAFLGEPEDRLEEPLEQPTMDPRERSPELAEVVEELDRGRPWNALASLRRILETRLRSIASDAGIPSEGRGAGSLLRDLERREVIPTIAAEHLGFALNVANRGVHGLELSVGEAEEAFRHALMGLRELNERGT
jgi:hypothetical protein